jgi:hypothetical protein
LRTFFPSFPILLNENKINNEENILTKDKRYVIFSLKYTSHIGTSMFSGLDWLTGLGEADGSLGVASD